MCAVSAGRHHSHGRCQRHQAPAGGVRAKQQEAAGQHGSMGAKQHNARATTDACRLWWCTLCGLLTPSLSAPATAGTYPKCISSHTSTWSTAYTHTHTYTYMHTCIPQCTWHLGNKCAHLQSCAEALSHRRQPTITRQATTAQAQHSQRRTRRYAAQCRRRQIRSTAQVQGMEVAGCMQQTSEHGICEVAEARVTLCETYGRPTIAYTAKLTDS